MILDFFIGGCIHKYHCAHDFFRLAPLGTQFFLGNVDIFSTRKFASSMLRGGGGGTPKTIFFLAVVTSHKKSSQCADVEHHTRKAVSVRTLNI